MGRLKEKQMKHTNGAFKFTKIDPKTIEWRNSSSKYQDVIEKVSRMTIGEALRVEGITRSNAKGYIIKAVYEKVKGNYRIRSRYIEDGSVTYFYKQDK